MQVYLSKFKLFLSELCRNSELIILCFLRIARKKVAITLIFHFLFLVAIFTIQTFSLNYFLELHLYLAVLSLYLAREEQLSFMGELNI